MTETVLRTARFGELAYAETHIVHLVGGLLGIPGTDRVLVVQPGGTGPLCWLQSVTDPALAVVVADLAYVAPDYRPVVSAADLAELELERPEDAIVLGVAVLASDPQASTVNLRAPLIINPVLRRGRQIVMEDDRYAIRHPLVLPTAKAMAAGQG